MINIRKLEAELWESADLLRQGSKLTSSQYCMPVLALLFLRYAYSRYKMVEAEILQNRPSRGGRVMPVEPSDFAAKSALYLPREAQFDYLVNLPDNIVAAGLKTKDGQEINSLGEAVNNAMQLVEDQSEQLAGVLPKTYTMFAADSWLILPMENEVGKLTEKETQKKYYFIDNGLLNLFLMNSETSLLENMVAVELCRRFGKKNVFFLNAEKEIDFIVPDEKLAIQVSYSIKDETTYNREVPPLAKYAKAHEDWKCLLITYDEEGMEEGIPVVPAWKWLMGCEGF